MRTRSHYNVAKSQHSEKSTKLTMPAMTHVQRRSSGTPPRKPLSTPSFLRLSTRRRAKMLLLTLAFTLTFLIFLCFRATFTISSPPRHASSVLTDAYLIAPPATTASQIQTTLTSLRAQPIPLQVTLVHPGLSLTPSLSALSQIVTPLNNVYDAILTLPATRNPPLYIHAGTKLSRHALLWLKQAQTAYSKRPDVAAFFLDGARPRVKKSGPDHDPASWQLTPPPSAGSAFLYSLAVRSAAFVPNYGEDLRVWQTFREWLLIRRSDWYKYPSGLGVDETPLGMSALPERNWTRAAWNVWFSKFVSEYELAVVYPNLNGKALAVNDDLDASRDMRDGEIDFRMFEAREARFEFPRNVERFAGSGKSVKASELISKESVKSIVDLGREQGGVISFTMVNKVFLDTARSWLCNVDVAKFRPKGLLWAVTDVETRDAMQKVEGSRTVWLDEVKGGKETGHEFGNPGYWKLMLERTALIGEILKNGVAVFAFETDAIWLEDPAPYIDELVRQEADVVGTINTRMEVSGNFFYLRPTLATRRLWSEIVLGFEKAYKDAQFEKKSATSWTYIENDQSLLTKLVLRNETWRTSYPLNFLTLDMERFVDGRWYKPEEGFYTSERARQPVVINNNFVIGVEEKTTRAKKWGHWFWDESTGKCLSDVVDKAVRQQTQPNSPSDGHDGAFKPRRS